MIAQNPINVLQNRLSPGLRKDYSDYHTLLMAQAFQAASKPFAQIARTLRAGVPQARNRVDIVSPQLCGTLT